MELVTVEDCMEELKGLEDLAEKIEHVLSVYKPPLGGERYLTGEQVCTLLNLSKRTLLDYREKGDMPYITLFGKMLYKESDILAILEENYVPRFSR